MAAKEEAAVLKYLKKNPSKDALDISFGTDIDESLVKESLLVLQGKGEVEQKDIDGRPHWSLAAPKPKPAPAPKAEPVASEAAPSEKPAKAPRAASVEDEEETASSGAGVSKGFVFGVSLVTLLVALGGGWVLGGLQASAATKAQADTEIKALRDSTRLGIMNLNTRIDGLESKIRDLKAPAAPAAEPAAKSAAKPAKKKKK